MDRKRAYDRDRQARLRAEHGTWQQRDPARKAEYDMRRYMAGVPRSVGDAVSPTGARLREAVAKLSPEDVKRMTSLEFVARLFDDVLGAGTATDGLNAEFAEKTGYDLEAAVRELVEEQTS
jgi:hypothetical protein